jgi:hypothetical protein
MNKLLLVITAGVVLVLGGCGKSEPGSSSIETVETLVANPARLKELRAKCKGDHAAVGDAQCNAVAEATRRRFMSGGPSPYASDPVRPSEPGLPPAGSGSRD